MALACVRFNQNTIFLWLYDGHVQMSTPERLGFMLGVPYYGRVVGKKCDRINMLLAESIYGSRFVVKIRFGNICLMYYDRQPGAQYSIVELAEPPKERGPLRERKRKPSPLRNCITE